MTLESIWVSHGRSMIHFLIQIFRPFVKLKKLCQMFDSWKKHILESQRKYFFSEGTAIWRILPLIKTNKWLSSFPASLLCHKFYIHFKHQQLTQFFGQADFEYDFPTLHAKSFQNILLDPVWHFWKCSKNGFQKCHFFIFLEKSNFTMTSNGNYSVNFLGNPKFVLPIINSVSCLDSENVA